jgi:hypothetical protein
MKQDVDFATEKLVVFAWTDEGTSWGVTGDLERTPKRTVATFTWHQGKSKGAERRDRFVAFVVPKDANVMTAVDPKVPK